MKNGIIEKLEETLCILMPKFNLEQRTFSGIKRDII